MAVSPIYLNLKMIYPYLFRGSPLLFEFDPQGYTVGIDMGKKILFLTSLHLDIFICLLACVKLIYCVISEL